MFQPVLICIGRSRYDDDGSGEIDAEELQGIMENLGVSVTEEEIEKMVLEIDEDGSGERKKKREGKAHFSSSSIYETRKERETQRSRGSRDKDHFPRQARDTHARKKFCWTKKVISSRVYTCLRHHRF